MTAQLGSESGGPPIEDEDSFESEDSPDDDDSPTD